MILNHGAWTLRREGGIHRGCSGGEEEGEEGGFLRGHYSRERATEPRGGARGSQAADKSSGAGEQ